MIGMRRPIVTSLTVLIGVFGVGGPRRERGDHEAPAAHVAIVGGRDAYGPQFAGLAFVRNESGDEVHQCSGTVISANVVLTAGHCVESASTGAVYQASGFTVQTGAVDLASSSVEVSGVSEVRLDPNFDYITGANDAALLVLSHPTMAPPIELASGDGIHGGTKAYLAGWGVTSATSHVLPSQLHVTSTVVRSSTWCEARVPRYAPHSEICAIASPKYASGPCRGDSGGPLFVAVAPSARTLEVGIVSRASPTCSTHLPAVFTAIHAVHAWIEQTLRKVEGG
jgi:trypsin